MRPGEEFIQGALSLSVEAGLQSGLLKSAKPVSVIKLLTPGIKG